MFPTQANKARNQAWQAELGNRKYPKAQVDKKIRTALGRHGDRWVLIGGPPCQAYSLIGRSRIKGKSIKDYESDNRHFLYRQYLKILAEHKPPVFVMENVKGLLSTEINDQRIVEHILRDLRNPSQAVRNSSKHNGAEYVLHCLAPTKKQYTELTPEDFIVKSEAYGIPQTRHRIILLGIRADVRVKPKHLIPQESTLSVEQAIGDVPPVRSGISRMIDSYERWLAVVRSITRSEWLKEGAVTKEIRGAIKAVAESQNLAFSRGGEFVKTVAAPQIMAEWFRDTRLRGVCNHSTRRHMESDLHRYLFASAYAQVNGHSPRLIDFPKGLLPDHANVGDAIRDRKFGDRFHVQVSNRPASTVTAHICKDGHYFIHYDSKQCRSLTVREVARLQTFPDNYFFEGPRTEQYRQVGNAVPPLLAIQIADIVAGIFYQAGNQKA